MLRAGVLATSDPQAAGESLAEIDRLLAARDTPRPLVRIVEEQVLGELSNDPTFVGPLAEDVGAVIALTIRYVARRLDFPPPFMRGDFTDENVLEEHLANDFELGELAAGHLKMDLVGREREERREHGRILPRPDGASPWSRSTPTSH